MRLLRSGVAVGLVGIVWVLSSASTAQALIQVQKGISGIRLEMSTSRVRASLGTPANVRHGHNDFGPFTEYFYGGGITVTFQGNQNVTAIAITGRTDRTASGVGVGSTRKQVKQGVPGVKCSPSDCLVGSLKPGKRVTDFMLRDGRVSRVTVGFVLD